MHLILINENDFKIVELNNNIDSGTKQVNEFLLITDFRTNCLQRFIEKKLMILSTVISQFINPVELSQCHKRCKPMDQNIF